MPRLVAWILRHLAHRSSVLPKSKLSKAISYAINQWPNLDTYFGDGWVAIGRSRTQFRWGWNLLGNRPVVAHRSSGYNATRHVLWKISRRFPQILVRGSMTLGSEKIPFREILVIRTLTTDYPSPLMHFPKRRNYIFEILDSDFVFQVSLSRHFS